MLLSVRVRAEAAIDAQEEKQAVDLATRENTLYAYYFAAFRKEAAACASFFCSGRAPEHVVAGSPRVAALLRFLLARSRRIGRGKKKKEYIECGAQGPPWLPCCRASDGSDSRLVFRVLGIL